MLCPPLVKITVPNATRRSTAHDMWKQIAPWQLKQLQRLSSLDPERCETFLNTLYRQVPGLYEDLVIMAVDANELSAEKAAELLQVPSAEIDARLQVFRRLEAVAEQQITRDGESQVARLQSGGVAIWEIVRELRKLGSVERLESSFPSLSRGDIAAALRYAQNHPEEIESQIRRYEDSLMFRRSMYPNVVHQ